MLNQSREIYGLNIAKSVRLWWGAKALYHNFGIELIPKKVQIVGATLEEQESISRWVDSVGLPAIAQLVVDERLEDKEERSVSYRDPRARFLIFANPRQTYGYLYICATPYDPH